MTDDGYLLEVKVQAAIHYLIKKPLELDIYLIQCAKYILEILY